MNLHAALALRAARWLDHLEAHDEPKRWSWYFAYSLAEEDLELARERVLTDDGLKTGREEKT